MGSIKVAVTGVGNCCSALIQGVHYYREHWDSLGLVHETVGGFKAKDIEFVAAFDIEPSKIGRDLSESIFSPLNTAPKIRELPKLDVKVTEGVDGESGRNIETARSNVVNKLVESDAEILLNLISGSAHKSSRLYAEAALEADCSFLNATPAIIACDTTLVKLFEDRGLPLVGDDLLDQIGATALHMGILEFLNSRGVRIDESYQLDVGGGAESRSTFEKTRDLKRKIKTEAVSKSVSYSFPLVSGSTDYVDFMNNQRDSFFWFKGRYFSGASFTMDVKLSTIDAPNAGSILIDAIRGLKLARKRGLKGVIHPISSYGFKNAPKKCTVSKAYNEFKRFIE
ncbi:inositol-3-phosphate synthase [Candidatus Bathyarchaeota archaeon]|nr:inositol-3-phosphate synthase [Candidatus Bathyarchaeota archaeon]MBS7630462.1 inositol-3-phosphate synthase [Candidatus Bathyarchaeota archaeon]